MTIGFIGLGNMAKAMIGGILQKGLMGPNEIIGSANTEETCLKVANKYGIQTRNSNAAVAKEADIIVLAVKPQYLKVVIADIMDSIDENKVIVSIAAGKTIAWIENEFEKPTKIIRVMPNTPALVGVRLAVPRCRPPILTHTRQPFRHILSLRIPGLLHTRAAVGHTYSPTRQDLRFFRH